MPFVESSRRITEIMNAFAEVLEVSLNVKRGDSAKLKKGKFNHFGFIWYYIMVN